MNIATKTPPHDRRLKKFFRSELLGIAAQYRREGRELLAGNPDPDLSSYYIRRSQTKMSKQDFESGSCRHPGELAQALNELWSSQGYEELCKLAPQLAKLAESLKRSQQETDEISPFVYVMY